MENQTKRLPLPGLPCPSSMFLIPVTSLSQSLIACGSLVALDQLDLYPITGPFWAFFFPFSKDPKRGSRGPVAVPWVVSQKRCCSVERHVESQGEKEEDIINHGLLKARREQGAPGSAED